MDFDSSLLLHNMLPYADSHLFQYWAADLLAPPKDPRDTECMEMKIHGPDRPHTLLTSIVFYLQEDIAQVVPSNIAIDRHLGRQWFGNLLVVMKHNFFWRTPLLKIHGSQSNVLRGRFSTEYKCNSYTNLLTLHTTGEAQTKWDTAGTIRRWWTNGHLTIVRVEDIQPGTNSDTGVTLMKQCGALVLSLQ
ncbi:hypothetical protein FB451DRAFT_1178011 [Mycena latifolia]|nr:hypothetical protein FB451DRAFT_1178011 [Mycena latifolia]